MSRDAFTSEDIRFTYNAPYLYANVLKWPENGKVTIQSLKDKSPHFLGHIDGIAILGFDNEVSFSRDESGLHVSVAGAIDTEYPVCLKIRID